jgi:hypothetical protein
MSVIAGIVIVAVPLTLGIALGARRARRARSLAVLLGVGGVLGALGALLALVGALVPVAILGFLAVPIWAGAALGCLIRIVGARGIRARAIAVVVACVCACAVVAVLAIRTSTAVWIGTNHQRLDGTTRAFEAEPDGSVRLLSRTPRLVSGTERRLPFVGTSRSAARGGWRAFEREDAASDASTLWIASPDGVRYRVMDDVGNQLEWSPDGRALAFIVGAGERRLVHVVHVSEPAVVEGRLPAVCQGEPVVWSRDSRSLVYATNVPTSPDCLGHVRLAVVDAQDGSLLAAAPILGDLLDVEGPAVSADGRWAAAGSDAGVTLVALRKPGAVPVVLRGCSGPSWSPRGSRVALGCGNHLTLLDPATGTRTDTEIATERDFTTASWSPDGTRVSVTNDDGVDESDMTGSHVTHVPIHGSWSGGAWGYTASGRLIIGASNGDGVDS